MHVCSGCTEIRDNKLSVLNLSIVKKKNGEKYMPGQAELLCLGGLGSKELIGSESFSISLKKMISTIILPDNS